ncbi:MAG TPA: hypothetical protein DCS66_22790 [Flavobacteriaceae bacterium]|nr:hypothetical protein [Flavobacteriaceae bacterium]
MLELLQKNKGLALLVFGAATQLAGILMYAQNMITTINHNSEVLEELTTLTQQLNGRLTRIEFDSQRNYSLSNFQTDKFNEEIERLEGDIKVLEQNLFR